MSFVEQHNQRRGLGANPLRKQLDMVFIRRGPLRSNTNRRDLHSSQPATVNPGTPPEFPEQPLLAPEGAGAQALGTHSAPASVLADAFQQDRFPVSARAEEKESLSGWNPASEASEPVLSELKVPFPPCEKRRHLPGPGPERIAVGHGPNHIRSLPQRRPGNG